MIVSDEKKIPITKSCKCNLCQEKFSSKKEVKRHLKNEHHIKNIRFKYYEVLDELLIV